MELVNLIASGSKQCQVSMFNLFDEADADAVNFLRNCNKCKICLDIECTSHDDVLMDEDVENEELRLFRLYLSGTAMTKDWNTHRMISNFVRDLFLTEEFQNKIIDSPDLMRTERCQALNLDDSLGGEMEYSIVNCVQPHVYKLKGHKYGTAEYFFTAEVTYDELWTSVVPRSIFTLAHFMESKKYPEHHHGVPKALATMAQTRQADFSRKLKHTASLNICLQSETSKKRKHMESEMKTLGVVSNVSTFEIVTASFKIKNPSALLGFGMDEYVTEHMKVPESTDEDDDAEEDQTDDEDEEDVTQKIKDYASSVLDDLDIAAVISEEVVSVHLSVLKNSHSDASFGIVHHLATVFYAGMEKLIQLLVVTKKQIDQNWVLDKKEPPGLKHSEGKPDSIFEFSDDTICFLLPPPLVKDLAVGMTGKNSSYTLNPSNEFKPSASKEFFADFRVGFQINTHQLFDRIAGEDYDLMVYKDLAEKTFSNKKSISKFYKSMEDHLRIPKGSVQKLLNQKYSEVLPLFETHKTRMIAATSMAVQPLANIKRMYTKWLKGGKDFCSELEKNKEFCRAEMDHFFSIIGSSEAGKFCNGFSDDDQMIFHHDKNLSRQIVERDRVARKFEQGHQRDASLFEALVKSRLCAKFLSQNNVLGLGGHDQHQTTPRALAEIPNIRVKAPPLTDNIQYYDPVESEDEE